MPQASVLSSSPRPASSVEGTESIAQTAFRPKSDYWQSDVTDDEEGFGRVGKGDEIGVQIPVGGKDEFQWRDGVVAAVSQHRPPKVAVYTSDAEMVEVQFGQGFLRRKEDDPSLCTEEEIAEIYKLRFCQDVEGLCEYCRTSPNPAARSKALTTLCRMREVQAARRVMDEGIERFSSLCVRELAHAHARLGMIEEALVHADLLVEAMSAQLVVEVLAVGLSWCVEEETSHKGKDQVHVSENKEVLRLVRFIKQELRRLDPIADAVRQQPVDIHLKGLQDAFNELLLACGKAQAAPVAFLVLEYMEGLAVPKNRFTYEGIGLNIVKNVIRSKRVWDLPMMPEEGAPEIVFAGRSNVGKSSLVNMLLNQEALAPMSSRPGKTKTMDFFDVNNCQYNLPTFRLVDVPGLGFARASQDQRDRWVGLIGGYFVKRKSLKLVFHLLDASLCQILPADLDLWRLLAQARRDDYELCICLTKADNSNVDLMTRFAVQIRELLAVQGSGLTANATIFACSSHSKMGKDTLWRKIWDSVGGPAVLQAGEDIQRRRETELKQDRIPEEIAQEDEDQAAYAKAKASGIITADLPSDVPNDQRRKRSNRPRSQRRS